MVDSPVSILRIKRKRADHSLPLEALLIAQSEPSSKRRRNLEPGASSEPLPSRAIFRFAETVSSTSFDSASEAQQITDRISSVARLSPASPALRRESSNHAIRQGLGCTVAPPASPSRKLPSQVRAARAAAAEAGGVSSARAGPGAEMDAAARRQGKVDSFHQEAKRARYRIIEKARASFAQADERDAYRGPRPPEVLTASEINKQPAPKIYDAIEEGDLEQPTRPNIIPSSSSEHDELMSSFVPLLQEYLSLKDPLASPDRSKPTPPAPAEGAEAALEDDEDFVYDLYYKQDAPVASSSAESSMLGPSQGGFDVGSLAGLQRIGELAGLDEDEILQEDVSDEEEDEADQDSNEEGDYRNDYPEGEEEDEFDSDEFDDDGDRPSWSD